MGIKIGSTLIRKFIHFLLAALNPGQSVSEE